MNLYIRYGYLIERHLYFESLLFFTQLKFLVFVSIRYKSNMSIQYKWSHWQILQNNICFDVEYSRGDVKCSRSWFDLRCIDQNRKSGGLTRFCTFCKSQIRRGSDILWQQRYDMLGFLLHIWRHYMETLSTLFFLLGEFTDSFSSQRPLM